MRKIIFFIKRSCKNWKLNSIVKFELLIKQKNLRISLTEIFESKIVFYLWLHWEFYESDNLNCKLVSIGRTVKQISFFHRPILQHTSLQPILQHTSLQPILQHTSLQPILQHTSLSTNITTH